MKMVIKHTITLAVFAVCCVQAVPQKLKKVSKPDDGKQWTVTIYEVENPGENEPADASDRQGKRISQSKFRKDTDGRFTNKLRFDFSNTSRNKVVYGPKGQECKVIVAEFDPVEDLTAVLNPNCTIDFNPPVSIALSKWYSVSLLSESPLSKSELSKHTQSIKVMVPETSNETWSIASGDLTQRKLNDKRKKYTLDEISGTAAEINTKQLRIYTGELGQEKKAMASKIAVKIV